MSARRSERPKPGKLRGRDRIFALHRQCHLLIVSCAIARFDSLVAAADSVLG